MSAFLEGIIAGYGIAIPVGAISVLIVEMALRRGFRFGFAAGAGAASADLTYATLAALAGSLLADLLSPYELPLRILSAGVLILLGAWGLRRVLRDRPQTNDDADQPLPESGPVRTYLQFLGLTLLNPMTVAYFGALILGGGASELGSMAGRTLFVAGAALASLSWQSFIALIGAVARRFFTPRFRLLTSVFGNLVVIGLGVRIIVLLIR